MIKRFLLLFISITIFTACNEKQKTITSIEGGHIKVCATKKVDGAEEVRAILEEKRATVDSIKAPIIGTSATALIAERPESPLMNFAADALLHEAQKHSNTNIDLAITNKGGLRNIIPQGVVTFGDVYNVFPFENTLALLTLDGEQLLQLFKEIAQVGGEAISGARLTITTDGKLLQASVGGEPVILTKKYRIATSDYLSQGNDKLFTLGKGSDKEIMSKITLRDLMIQHIADKHKKGESIEAKNDGRITIKDNL